MQRILFVLLLCLILWVPAAAQEPTVDSLAALEVTFWPDFDNPSVLVLMTGTLPPETEFPAVVALPLPDDAELNAVARVTDEGLFDDIDFKNENGSLTLLVKGTNFQINVWKALLRIPAGLLCSYSQVARAMGNPSASRVVGRALAVNPVAYLIPCHRVIRKVGIPGDYRWGDIRKKALIAWETANLSAHPEDRTFYGL